MFARFRQAGRRLKVSLAATRRAEGRVLQEHVASLGSVITPPDTADRIAFWQRLHERLARLANRIDAETQGKILGQVHARIAMPTLDEIRGLQLENAAADEQLWSTLADMHDSSAADQAGLRDMADKAVTESRASAENAKKGAAAAKDRILRLKNGESVAGGLGKPVDVRAQCKAAGMTESELRHYENWAELIRLVSGGNAAAANQFMKEFARDSVERADRSSRVRVRRMLKGAQFLRRLDEANKTTIRQSRAEYEAQMAREMGVEAELEAVLPPRRGA